MVSETLESEPLVERGSPLIERMHDYNLDPDLLRNSCTGAQSVREQDLPSTLATDRAATRQPRDENTRDWEARAIRLAIHRAQLLTVEAVGTLCVVPKHPVAAVFVIDEHPGKSVALPAALPSMALEPLIQLRLTRVEQASIVPACKCLYLPHKI